MSVLIRLPYQARESRAKGEHLAYRGNGLPFRWRYRLSTRFCDRFLQGALRSLSGFQVRYLQHF